MEKNQPSYTSLFKHIKKYEGDVIPREQISTKTISSVFEDAGETLGVFTRLKDFSDQVQRVCEIKYPKLGAHLHDTGSIVRSMMSDETFQLEYPDEVRRLVGDDKEQELEGFFSSENQEKIAVAGEIHDIGKLDPEIMRLCEWDNKTMGPFPRENGLYKIRQHSAVDDVLTKAGIIDKQVIAAIQDHHAPVSWGTKDPFTFYGFEKGSSNNSALHYLFLSTNIVTICDILSAMTEFRSYHQADRIVLWEETANEIKKKYDTVTEQEIHSIRYTIEKELRICLPMDREGRIVTLALETFARLYETIERKAKTRPLLKDKKLPRDFEPRMIPRQK